MAENRGPLRDGDVLRRMLPFAATAVIAFALVPILPVSRPDSLLGAAVIVALIVLAALALPWTRLPRWTQALPPLAYFGAVYLMRDAGGAGAAGYGVLALLPVLWFALYGALAELVIAVVGIAVTLMAPTFALASWPPPIELRRTILIVLVGMIVGLAVQRLVGRLQHREREDSQRRRALDEAEEHFRTAFENAPIGMALTSLDGCFQRVNRALCEMLGRTASELSGTPVAEVTLPASTAADERAMEQLTRGELDAYRTEKDYLHASGRAVRVALSATVARDAGGTPLHFVSQMEDITDRRLAEKALVEAEERFRLAFEGAPIGIALADPQGGFLRVNTALCEITGHREEELLVTGLPSLLHPDDMEAALNGMQCVAADEARSYQGELRLLHAGGDPLWISLSASLVRDSEGRPLYLIQQVQDISERKRFEGQLEYLADHDPLTGLLNRVAFQHALDDQAAYGARYGRRGAVVVLDVDNFKDVNDTLGHAAGDEIISRLAALLRTRLRKTDILGRLGGDEFAVILREADAAQAELVAAELLVAVREQSVAVSSKRVIRLSASAGIALFDGDTELTGEELLVNADIAMYDAKEAGRDRVAVCADGGVRQAQMQARLTWAQRIREALEHDRFVLYQQPILDLSSGRVTRHELLLRMVGDNGEIVPPGAFLLVAERFGLIGDIDRWVTRHAIRTIAAEQRAGRRLLLEVNLSGASVTDPDLFTFIERELATTGADPSCLIFELTETAAIVNVERARTFAMKLAELGCEFALDDFGAGFGSFYYLKHLPFDYLKIDGDFIKSLPTNRQDQLVVTAIVQIAQGMGKRTIAEFVGDERTVRLLCRLGVDFAQGYHVAPPSPLAPLLTSGAAAPESSDCAHSPENAHSS